MKSEPTVESRAEQGYVGLRKVMPMSDFATAIPSMTETVAKWLESRGSKPLGKPFLLYHVIDMPKRMDVELAFPVDVAPAAEGPMTSDRLPQGRYAVLGYRGVKNALAANKKLIEWIAAQGEEMVSHDSANGQVFAARYEVFLTDAKSEPDQDKWDTEIAIKLRDKALQ